MKEKRDKSKELSKVDVREICIEEILGKGWLTSEYFELIKEVLERIPLKVLYDTFALSSCQFQKIYEIRLSFLNFLHDVFKSIYNGIPTEQFNTLQ